MIMLVDNHTPSHGCTGLAGPLLSVFAQSHGFAWCSPYDDSIHFSPGEALFSTESTCIDIFLISQ